MVVTGTWYRVGAFPEQTARTNTFQIVLVTDEIWSFAFLLYHELQWASPSSGSGPSPAGELGGQAGFNAGDGAVFEMLPYSRTSNIRLQANLGNVNVPGLFVFRIDTDTVAVGGCGNTSSLSFRPRRGSQLGPTAVTVQGPCFNSVSAGDVKCRFGDSLIVDAIIIDEIRAICVTPAVGLHSIVSFYVSLEPGTTFRLFPNTFAYTSAEYGLTSADNAPVTILNRTSMIVSTGVALTMGWSLSDSTVSRECVRLADQLITRGAGGGRDNRYLPASFPILHFFSDTLPFLPYRLLTSDDESCTRYFNL